VRQVANGAIWVRFSLVTILLLWYTSNIDGNQDELLLVLITFRSLYFWFGSKIKNGRAFHFWFSLAKILNQQKVRKK